MALNDIRDQIKVLIDSVTGVPAANVHTYERIIDSEDIFRQLYEDKSLPGIHGWTITRESAAEEANIGVSWLTHLMVLKGWYRLNDAEASEKNFELIVDLVFDALRTQLKSSNVLGGFVWSIRPPQLRTFHIETIFNTYCNYVEILLSVVERNVLPT